MAAGQMKYRKYKSEQYNKCGGGGECMYVFLTVA